MLNLIVLMGRATKDPMLRKSAGEKAISIVNFDIAVDSLMKESDGSQSTSFFAVTCFGKVADNVANYVRKGSKVAIQGSVQQRSYLTQKGEKRTTYDVIADSVEFLDPKPVEEPQKEVDEADIPEDAKEVAPEEPKEQLFDPYTGKPLKAKAKK